VFEAIGSPLFDDFSRTTLAHAKAPIAIKARFA